MKKFSKLLIILLLIVSVLSSPIAMAATPQFSPTNLYISSYVSKCYAIGNGQVKISFSTAGTDVMDTIGASVIKVYDKNGLVFTFNMSNAAYKSQMLGNDTVAYTGSVIYNGTENNTYYAIVTHYAAKDGGSGTENYTTNSVST